MHSACHTDVPTVEELLVCGSKSFLLNLKHYRHLQIHELCYKTNFDPRICLSTNQHQFLAQLCLVIRTFFINGTSSGVLSQRVGSLVFLRPADLAVQSSRQCPTILPSSSQCNQWGELSLCTSSMTVHGPLSWCLPSTSCSMTDLSVCSICTPFHKLNSCSSLHSFTRQKEGSVYSLSLRI